MKLVPQIGVGILIAAGVAVVAFTVAANHEIDVGRTNWKPIVRINVLRDGSVELEGKRFSDAVALKAYIAEINRRSPRPVLNLAISIPADDDLKFETVGRAIDLLDRAGPIRAGFITEPAPRRVPSSHAPRSVREAIQIARARCDERPDDKIKGSWSATLHGGLWDVVFSAPDDQRCPKQMGAHIDVATGKVKCWECVGVDFQDRAPVHQWNTRRTSHPRRVASHLRRVSHCRVASAFL